jgi:hypothetical protein
VEPLEGEGGTTGHGDVGGLCVPPPTQLKAPCAMRTCTCSIMVEGGANGGTAVTRHRGLVSHGVNNLGEDLAAICSLASFPLMLGAPAYKLWEARLLELFGYVQRYPAAGRHGSFPLAREIGAAVAPGGGATSVVTCKVATGLAMTCLAQSVAAPTRPATPIVVLGRPILATEIPAPAKTGAAVVTLRHCEESRSAALHHQQEWHGPA